MFALAHGKRVKKKEKRKKCSPAYFTSHHGFFLMSAKETRVDVESNTSGWNQTCKNLIRFLQDRISNKREKKKSGSSSSSIGSTKIFIQIKLMIFLLLFSGLVE